MSAIILLALSTICIFVLTQQFKSMKVQEVIYKGPGVTSIEMLSDYYPELKGTSGDTEVYILEGKNPGASMLVLGGTHPNEPSGFVSAILLIENLIVDEGTLYVDRKSVV